MYRPMIRQGVDDRLLLAVFVAFALAIGCVDRGGETGGGPTKPITGKRTLEQVAFESFQNRDVVRAQKLRALKGTKYDDKRMDAIAKAGAEASQETWEPVAKELAALLDRVPQDDQETFDKVIESLAKAAERAGGK